MSEVSEKAGRASGGTGKRQAAKPSSSGKRQAGDVARLQLHLDREVVRRLGVHCSLRETNWSAEVQRILLRYLVKEGRGRELFSNPDYSPDEGESAALAG